MTLSKRDLMRMLDDIANESTQQPEDYQCEWCCDELDENIHGRGEHHLLDPEVQQRVQQVAPGFLYNYFSNLAETFEV
jgi:hypothetical protein